MKTLAVLILSLTLTYSWLCFSQTDESWPRFRGINGSGVAAETAKPHIVFDSTNLRWKFDISPGVSSPVIWKNQLFLTGFIESSKELQTICIDRLLGTLMWKSSVKPDTIERVHQIGSPAQSSVATDGEHVVSYFGSCGLFCYNMQGDLQWKYAIACNDQYFGSGTSPIISGNKVLLVNDFGTKPFLIAINIEDGSVVWKTYLQLPTIPNTGGHSVPCLADNIIVIHRIGEITGFSVHDGSRQWGFRLLTCGVSSPIIAKEKVITSCWYNLSEDNQRGKLPDFGELITKYDANKNGTIDPTELPDDLIFYFRPENKLEETSKTVKDFFTNFDLDANKEISQQEWEGSLNFVKNFLYKPSGLVALNIGSIGELSDTSALWKVTEDIPEVPCPVFYKDRIYMVKDGGILSCIDSESGKLLYKTRIGNASPHIASPIAANGLIYIFGFNGKLKIVKAGDTYELAGQNDFSNKIVATPAIIGNTIYIRTGKELLAYSNK